MDMEFIRYLAELSGICFTQQEMEEMTGDMADIVALMDKIKDVDKTLPPYCQAPMRYLELRRDLPEETQGTDREFTVPRILG